MANIRVTTINKSFLDFIYKELGLDQCQNEEMIQRKMGEVKYKLEAAMTDNGLQGVEAEINWYRAPSDNIKRWNALADKHKPGDDKNMIDIIQENPELY